MLNLSLFPGIESINKRERFINKTDMSLDNSPMGQ